MRNFIYLAAFRPIYVLLVVTLLARVAFSRPDDQATSLQAVQAEDYDLSLPIAKGRKSKKKGAQTPTPTPITLPITRLYYPEDVVAPPEEDPNRPGPSRPRTPPLERHEQSTDDEQRLSANTKSQLLRHLRLIQDDEYVAPTRRELTKKPTTWHGEGRSFSTTSGGSAFHMTSQLTSKSPATILTHLLARRAKVPWYVEYEQAENTELNARTIADAMIAALDPTGRLVAPGTSASG